MICSVDLSLSTSCSHMQQTRAFPRARSWWVDRWSKQKRTNCMTKLSAFGHFCAPTPPPLHTPAIERVPEDLLLLSHLGASAGQSQVRYLNHPRVHNILQRRVEPVRILCGASVTREEPELSCESFLDTSQRVNGGLKLRCFPPSRSFRAEENDPPTTTFCTEGRRQGSRLRSAGDPD